MSKQFQEMLLNHLPRLRTYALTLTRNQSDANDLTQSTVERILKYESQFQAGSNFPAWSYRVLKNNYISQCRRNKQQLTSLDQMSSESILPMALVSPARQDEHVLTKEVTQAMDKLTANSRETMMLVCGAQLSYEEVAEIMSCSPGTVKSRLWRAREQMKTLLMGTYDDETTNFLPPARAKSTWNAPNAIAC